MALAAFGNPIYLNMLRNSIGWENGTLKVHDGFYSFPIDGSYSLKRGFQKFFRHSTPKDISREVWARDLASSVQKHTEEIIIQIAKDTKKLVNSRNLCLSGGVFLNSVSNGKLSKKGYFDQYFR